MIVKQTEYISISESLEMGVTKSLYKDFFYFALKRLQKINIPTTQDLIVAFVLIITGLEQYVKSQIMNEYQSHPDLLTEDSQITNSGIPKFFKDRVRSKYPGQRFSHFNQPYELFTEFSQKNEFKDLVKWLYQIKGKKYFKYHSSLSDYYKIRSLFVHYWEFPLGAQKIDETGKEIKFENEFELTIESFDYDYFIDVLNKIILFFEHMKDKEIIKLIDNTKIIFDKLKAIRKKDLTT